MCSLSYVKLCDQLCCVLPQAIYPNQNLYNTNQFTYLAW